MKFGSNALVLTKKDASASPAKPPWPNAMPKCPAASRRLKASARPMASKAAAIMVTEAPVSMRNAANEVTAAVTEEEIAARVVVAVDVIAAPVATEAPADRFSSPSPSKRERAEARVP